MTKKRDWASEKPDDDHMRFLRTRNAAQYYEALCRMGEAALRAPARAHEGERGVQAGARAEDPSLRQRRYARDKLRKFHRDVEAAKKETV